MPEKGRGSMYRSMKLTGCGLLVLIALVARAQDGSRVLGLVCGDAEQQKTVAEGLGDCVVAGGEVDLSPVEETILHTYVEALLCSAEDADSTERIFARSQIQRLWALAAPALIDNAPSMNASIAETCSKHLSMMRTEGLIREIIEAAEEATSVQRKAGYIRLLGKMTEQSTWMVRGRETMDDATSRRVADTTVRPYLRQVREQVREQASDRQVLAAVHVLPLLELDPLC